MKEFMKTVWELTGKALIQGLKVIVAAIFWTIYLTAYAILCIVAAIIGLFGAATASITAWTRCEVLNKAEHDLASILERWIKRTIK